MRCSTSRARTPKSATSCRSRTSCARRSISSGARTRTRASSWSTRTTRADALVLASPNQLKQVVLNLIANARQAMPLGGTVHVEVSCLGANALVTVADDGPGIEPALLSRIFEPFFTTKRDVGGTGLGLSVSLGIAESHGGTLIASSEHGTGARFTVRLPLAAEAGAMSRILAIDDEHVIRMLVVEILESVGHDVVGAESAEHALDLLDTTSSTSIVSDVVMPGLSGLELLEAARSRHASLPVVLVTGAGTYETLSQALTRGAAGLVTKPFAHAELQTAVSDALERATRIAGRAARAPARPHARERARKRDRGARLVPARPLRAARVACSPDRGGPRRRAGGDRDRSPRRDPPRRREDRHPRPRPPQARPARRRGAADHRDAHGDRRQAARAARPARRRAADRSPPPRALGRRRLSRRARGRRRSRSARGSSPSPTRSRR